MKMNIVRDAIMLTGLAAIVAGLYQAWPPLAWIAGGSALCAGTLLSWRLERFNRKPRREG